MLLRRILARTRKHPGVANFCILNNGGPAILSPEKAASPSSSKEKSIEKGYVVSYLVNSIGMCVESAVSASRKVHFDVPDKPNAVLNLLQEQGFSKTQIAELVGRQPHLLVSNPDKFLLPKIEFFSQVAGISVEDVRATLSRRPDLLTRNLENILAPVYKFLEDNIGAAKAQTFLKRGRWVFNRDPAKTLIPNVDLLRNLGVPRSNITLALSNFPDMFWPKHVEFREIVEEVKQMGFDPLKSTFVVAINARLKGHSNTWDLCYEAYSKWGWSHDDIFMAFRKRPGCMLLSERKISSIMDFLVNKIGRDPRSVALLPDVMLYSAEKRIVPRCSFVHLLSLKGLIKKDWSLSSVLCPAEEVFVERYVTRYADKLPQIYDIYQEKKYQQPSIS